MNFHSLTPALIREFQSAFPNTSIISDTAGKQDYSHDYTEDLQFVPDLVALPNNAAEVASILQWCNERLIPVTTRGAGTGLSGGALPVAGGLVISTEKLNKIVHLDKANFQVTVEPGVINESLRQVVEAEGLFYPPDPASKGSCSLGGNIAHSSGGPKALKYGTTRDYVLNLQVALPNGSLIWTGANVLKYSTGYNLTQLMVGSEGTLGIVTAMVLKLIPLPKHNTLMLASFANIEQACEAVGKIFIAGHTPSALELMEKSAVLAGMEHTGENFPLTDPAETYLLIELDGNDPTILLKEAEEVAASLYEMQVLEILLADSSEQKERWWKVRRSMGEAVKLKSIYKEEDTVVPRAALPALMRRVKELGKLYGFESVCYGHAGDGNLHVNILKGDMNQEQWEQELPKAIREIFTCCKELGGTISGEHGIGLVQKSYMDVVLEPMHFELMKGIKKAFDPNGILNPGKIWPD